MKGWMDLVGNEAFNGGKRARLPVASLSVRPRTGTAWRRSFRDNGSGWRHLTTPAAGAPWSGCCLATTRSGARNPRARPIQNGRRQTSSSPPRFRDCCPGWDTIPCHASRYRSLARRWKARPCFLGIRTRSTGDGRSLPCQAFSPRIGSCGGV